jgi:membrane-bound lytic murein transglycosylase A
MKTKIISLVCAAILLLFAGWYFFFKQKVSVIKLHPIPFSELPGWKSGDLMQSFKTFQRSCKVFLKQDPDKSVGSEFIDLKAKDWFTACQAAEKLPEPYTSEQLRTFFETWFDAVEFYDGKPVQGLFTGYYMSSLKGSLKKTKQFNVPIYGLPDDLISVNLGEFDPAYKNKKLVGRVVDKHRLVPYFTRAEIDKGAIKKKAPVIAWVDSPIDRLFLEIQGSGVIQLPDGSPLYVGYIAQNGAPYTAIAGVLIQQGVMTRDNASMQHIREYLEANPKKIQPVLNQNKSFVFFETSNKPDAYGSQGTALTPGYSMAVDLKWVPMGTPVWLNTTRPGANNSIKNHEFKRLMIAQDTGGAIRGPVRGDVYWGQGDKATSIAGRMKNPGQYWLLLPKNVVVTQPQ